METDPLQQLRDIHLPGDPGWWPPAIGWWLLGIAVLATTAWIIRWCWRRWQRRAPLRQARRLLIALHDAHGDGALNDADYVHQANEIIKRVLVRAYHRQQFAPMAGNEWLQALNDLSGSNVYTAGAGQALGNARFARNPQVDADAIHNELLQLLSKVAA